MDRQKGTLIFIGSVAYLASLLAPAFACGSGEPTHGYDILAMGWFGILVGDPRWYANLIFIAVIFRVATAGDSFIHSAWAVASFVAVVFAVLSFVLPAKVCGDSGTVINHSGPMVGAFLWLGAMLCAGALVLRQGK